MKAAVLRFVLGIVPGTVLALLAVPLLGIAGCDKVEEITDKAEQASQQVQQQVEQRVDQVQEYANLAGNMELQLTGPISTQACYATFLVLPSQTGNVLQLASYSNPEIEKFPSIFLRANVGSTGSLAELAGQTVQAEMYVKTSAQDATWHVAAGAPVELMLGQMANGQITAEVSGELVRLEGSETTPVSGTMTAVTN